ncbi:MAG: GNAT family N-acetyltransferase [Geminicoccaceae bacterium]
MVGLDWQLGVQADWQALLSRARCGLQQGWSYGAALRGGGMRVETGILRDGKGTPIGCLQIADRRLLGPCGAAFLLRGPVWFVAPPVGDLQPMLLDAVRDHFRRRLLVWAPESGAGAPRRPIMTGYSTSWLALADGPDPLRRGLCADWRQRLRRAEDGGLAVQRTVDGAAIDWLLDCNEAYRQQIGYRGPTRAFLGRLAHAARAADELLLLLAHRHGDPVAGVMILRHGGSATYEVGYVTAEGRRLLATHLLLWRAIEILHAEGVLWLDLGGIATDRAPGIARFKLGLGGEVATLPGTFLCAGLRPPMAAATGRMIR